jgi:uncharacterized protein YcfL
MKTLTIVFAALILASCGSQADQESVDQVTTENQTLKMEVATDNPFVGTFIGQCKYGDLITVTNTETLHQVSITRYENRDCTGSVKIDNYSRSYTLKNVQKISGVHEVDTVEGATYRQVAWRKVNDGMILDISYWDNKAGIDGNRSHTMMEVVLSQVK